MDVDWVEVPAGRLLRGSPIEAIDEIVGRHADLVAFLDNRLVQGLPRAFFAKEAPRTEVDVPAFSISRTPITRGQWAEYSSATGADTPPDGDLGHPVDEVFWSATAGFCAWLSEEIGEPIALPTETQWERAARGDDAREYPWGDVFDPQAANLAEAGVGHTTPVGSFPRGASPHGVLDLAGNVDEWTATEYSPYPGAPADVPTTESWAADRHVTRGGSYQHCRDLARCARRHGVYPPLTGAGFRVVTPPA